MLGEYTSAMDPMGINLHMDSDDTGWLIGIPLMVYYNPYITG